MGAPSCFGTRIPTGRLPLGTGSLWRTICCDAWVIVGPPTTIPILLRCHAASVGPTISLPVWEAQASRPRCRSTIELRKRQGGRETAPRPATPTSVAGLAAGEKEGAADTVSKDQARMRKCGICNGAGSYYPIDEGPLHECEICNGSGMLKVKVFRKRPARGSPPRRRR